MAEPSSPGRLDLHTLCSMLGSLFPLFLCLDDTYPSIKFQLRVPFQEQYFLNTPCSLKQIFIDSSSLIPFVILLTANHLYFWIIIGLIPVSPYGSPGERNGTPLQYSCLENPMDKGAWWATVHGVIKSQTQLSNWAHPLWVDASQYLSSSN